MPLSLESVFILYVCLLYNFRYLGRVASHVLLYLIDSFVAVLRFTLDTTLVHCSKTLWLLFHGPKSQVGHYLDMPTSACNVPQIPICTVDDGEEGVEDVVEGVEER